jgi:hypothetical protein
VPDHQKPGVCVLAARHPAIAAAARYVRTVGATERASRWITWMPWAALGLVSRGTANVVRHTPPQPYPHDAPQTNYTPSHDPSMASYRLSPPTAPGQSARSLPPYGASDGHQRRQTVSPQGADECATGMASGPMCSASGALAVEDQYGALVKTTNAPSGLAVVVSSRRQRSREPQADARGHGHCGNTGGACKGRLLACAAPAVGGKSDAEYAGGDNGALVSDQIAQTPRSEVGGRGAGDRDQTQSGRTVDGSSNLKPRKGGSSRRSRCCAVWWSWLRCCGCWCRGCCCGHSQASCDDSSPVYLPSSPD